MESRDGIQGRSHQRDGIQGRSHQRPFGSNQHRNQHNTGRNGGRGWGQRDANSQQRRSEGHRFGNINSNNSARGYGRGSMSHQNNNRSGTGGRRGRGGRNNYSNHNNKRNSQNDDVALDIIEQVGVQSEHTISIAIEGCCHGELDRIYERIAKHEEQTGQKIELLLCCGDFQSLRHPSDFHSLSCPPKYRNLGTFFQYYSGVKVAPILTIFVGGNHESSQSLRELFYGGWVAPKIYYLGAAGVVRYKGLRIGGVSGIYKSHDYCMSRYETPPFDQRALRSVYHVRNVDVFRLKCLATTDDSNRIDIMLSHDWPQGIEQYGDIQGLLRKKPFFRQEVQENNLGSLPNRELLDHLKPRYWFAAHLHVKFKAIVDHRSIDPANKIISREQEGNLIPSQVITQSSSHISQAPAVNIPEATADIPHQVTEFVAVETSTNCNEKPDLTSLMTEFLSLDKCLPRRQYLSVLHVPISNSIDKTNDAQLEYDVEWLAIIRQTHQMDSIRGNRRVNIDRTPEVVTQEHVDDIRDLFGENLIIPANFSPTIPPYFASPLDSIPTPLPKPFSIMGNPQMDALLNKLQLEHICTVPWNQNIDLPTHALNSVPDTHADTKDQNEIDLDDNEDTKDQNEIDLDDNDDTKDQNEIDLDDNEDEIENSNFHSNDTTVWSNEHLNIEAKIPIDAETEANKKPRISEE